MPQMIFVNLPVGDLARSVAFYEAVGARKNPTFSDDTAACMVFSETIHAMLLTHEKFRQFTTKAIVDARTSAEVLICVSAESREAVDRTVEAAKTAGGGADPTPTQDFGFMYGRSYEDPDGHIWEVMWMDPAAAAGGPGLGDRGVSRAPWEDGPANAVPETNELSVTRFIAAPPEVVYRVWTTRTAEWWAPKPYTTPGVELDLRPGGIARMDMAAPDGTALPNQGVFLEVVPNERIVTTDAFRAGWIPAPAFMTAIFTFEPEGAGTRYTARARHWSAETRKSHEAMGFVAGWGLCAAQLAALCEAEAGRH